MPNAPKTCRAALLKAYREPLAVEEVPLPREIEAGAMLVKNDASSICGSDMHAWESPPPASMGITVNLPVVPGHEMMGRIADIGNVKQDSLGHPLKEGDRIIWSPGVCGRCYWCVVAKRHSLCPNRRYYGVSSVKDYPHLTGAFAEYTYVFPGSGLVKVPDTVKDYWASAASCALRSVVHAFERLGPLREPEVVVVQGTGPVGLFSTVMAARSGAARVIAIGAPADRLEVAKKWGADYTISVDVPHAERVNRVKELTGGLGADLVIEGSGARTAFTEGVDLLRRGGRFLVIGQVGPDSVNFLPAAVVGKEIDIIGSLSGNVSDYYKAICFLDNNRERFDFDAMFPNRYQLKDIHSAFVAMHELRDIKPVILYGK
ncbi:MAG: zinc-binding dehydrogenase [Candidatus Binataceae bacterium]